MLARTEGIGVIGGSFKTRVRGNVQSGLVSTRHGQWGEV
jgi:hypothetical protein